MNRNKLYWGEYKGIQNLIQNIDGEDKEIILVGDLNCDLLPDVNCFITQTDFLILQTYFNSHK